MKRVLIVEDEFLVALDLKATLEELGFGPVAVASCMQSAFREAGAGPDTAPELALVDVNLADGPTGPVIGSQLARSFGTAVLFLTANPQSAQVADGGLGILTKPIDRDGVQTVAAYAAAVHDGLAMPPPPGVIPLARGSIA
jgi:DNA-binding response OmpR family regulator